MSYYFFHAKDFFSSYINDKDFNLEHIVKNIAFVHNSTKISLVMKTLQDSKVEMAIVLDSYGAIRGLVTTEDIVEELVGEIWDEHAAMMMIPEPWSKNPHTNPDLKAFFEYHNSIIEAWDGPAAMYVRLLAKVLAVRGS